MELADGEAEAGESRGRNWLERLGLGRPELRAWALYDWANSAMMCTIITAVFPIYYEQVACKGMDPAKARQTFTGSTTLAMIMIAIASPLLGAIADMRGGKKRMLGAFLGLGAGSVAAMYFIHTGDVLLASVLFILANIGANGSFVFYDALLPHIARDDEIDRVSTAGYALGYIGGGLLLALNLAWILYPARFGLPSGANLTESQSTLGPRLAFLSVAIWWVVFAIPLFLRVSEPKAPPASIERLPLATIFYQAILRFLETVRSLRRYRQAFLMLLAFLVYNDGIGTIIRLAAIYGKGIGVKDTVIIAAVLLVQFVGIPFAFLFGMLADRIGAKRSIGLGLVVYVGICVFGWLMTNAIHFVILALLVGAVQGGTQALSRSLFARLIPREQSAEFFGFFGVAEKFAGILGPGLFWIIDLATGQGRTAILSVIAFFVIGGAILAMVDVKSGEREAARA